MAGKTNPPEPIKKNDLQALRDIRQGLIAW